MALDAAMVRLERGDEVAAVIRARGLDVSRERPAHLSPAQCVLITDAIDAVESARSAGLVCLAISGKTEAFRAAGARAVYRDPADFVARSEDALKLASPGAAHLTYGMMESLMRRA